MRLRRVLLVFSVAAHAACNQSSSPSAAQDPKRALGGVVSLPKASSAKALAPGPLFLTDVVVSGPVEGSFTALVFTSDDGGCQQEDAPIFHWYVPMDAANREISHHGMRLFIPAGKTLCFGDTFGQTKLVWAGFRP
jgi:hypothetical protein